MKKFILTSLVLFFLGVFATAQITLPPNGGNQKSIVKQYIGSLVSVSVEYNSPDVTSPQGQDRTGKIWGQLVPYGLNDLGFGLRQPAPWRAGANENTIISFSHDVKVNGKPIEAGTYGFHIIVEEEGPWTLIFTNNSTAWGSYFYEEKDDALRVEATPEETEFTEWLTYEFIDRQPESTTLAMKWEKIALPFKIEVENMKEVYVDNMRKELQNSKGFTHQAWIAAANYCARNKYNLEEALSWANTAISGSFVSIKNYNTLSAKANVLSAMGKTDEATAVMDEAIREPTATSFGIFQHTQRLINAGANEKALEVASYNHERFKGAWPTETGLMLSYSANGELKKALKHGELALENAPNPPNKNRIQSMVDKLKKGEKIN